MLGFLVRDDIRDWWENHQPTPKFPFEANLLKRTRYPSKESRKQHRK